MIHHIELWVSGWVYVRVWVQCMGKEVTWACGTIFLANLIVKTLARKTISLRNKPSSLGPNVSCKQRAKRRSCKQDAYYKHSFHSSTLWLCHQQVFANILGYIWPWSHCHLTSNNVKKCKENTLLKLEFINSFTSTMKIHL